jgi:hypothetical protein
VTPLGLLGLLFLILAFGLIIAFAAAARNRPARHVRDISAFINVRKAVGLAVEAGARLHISIGKGNTTGVPGASALAGLTVLERIARAASISDRPPVATAGDGSLAILTRDTLSKTYRSIGAESQYDPTAGRLTGLTPFSFAAGILPVISDEQVSSNVLIGDFGAEAALINDVADHHNAQTVAGTDNMAGQAVLFATAQEPLIGEEVFAGGAYLGAGPVHEASLRAQDVLRWLLVAIILVGVLLKFLGLDSVLLNILGGGTP